MSISIVIPTYNRAHLLTRAIESVIAQTSTNWELIVVDDGSTDTTDYVMKKYLSDKIRYVKQDNAGANKARNVGSRLARYRYVGFLDSDDELFSDWVNSIEEELKNDPAIVCVGTLRVEGNLEKVSLPRSLGLVFNNASGKFTNGASYVIQQDLLFAIGGFDENLRAGQHTELSFRLADLIVSKKITIANIYRPLVKIHIHEGPRIRSSSESKFKGAYHMLQKHSELMNRYPKVKKNYAKITSYHAFRQHHYLIALKSFITYCKYALLATFNVRS